MQDEYFMRHWAANHEQFSSDIESGLSRLAGGFARRLRAAFGIGSPYGSILRGAVAGAITVALWSTVMVLATAGSVQAAPLGTEVTASADCDLQPALA